MKIFFLATLLLVVFNYNIHQILATPTKSIGQQLDTFLQKMQQKLQRLQTLHKPCEPCKPSTKDESVCDCTNITPRKDCLEFYQNGFKIDGVYRLKGLGLHTLHVYCDQTTQGGGLSLIHI